MKKLANIFPTRSPNASKSRWNTILRKEWKMSEDKELIDKVNGVHFETRSDMRAWMKSASISIGNRSATECSNHWCEYCTLHIHLSFGYSVRILTHKVLSLSITSVIVNILRPCSKEREWKIEEDKKLLELYSHYGNE